MRAPLRSKSKNRRVCRGNSTERGAGVKMTIGKVTVRKTGAGATVGGEPPVTSVMKLTSQSISQGAARFQRGPTSVNP